SKKRSGSSPRPSPKALRPVVRCDTSPDWEGYAIAEVVAPRAPGVAPLRVDERAARRSLLDQIAKLESDLATLFCSAYPPTRFDWSVASSGGPRILSLGELERVRDELAERLARHHPERAART